MSKYITLLFLIFAIMIPRDVNAREVVVRSYLLNEEKEFFGTPLLPTLVNSATATLKYSSGKVVLSANPDGTGDVLTTENLVVNSIFVGSKTFTYNAGCPVKMMKPLDITHLMINAKFGLTNLQVNSAYKNCRTFITQNGVTKDYAKIGRMYIVHFDDYEPAPEPFLDLPWNYKSHGLTFADAALNIESFFDHEYPLLSTNLPEPIDVISFELNNKQKINYSSHDGYDWAANAHAIVGEPVLAAAGGTAQYVNTCGACGNAIHIDHGNGFQTRYYHLMSDGLITNNPNQSVPVQKGQPIGKIGYTGNVIPHGTDGAHIHFMVVQDKNGDDNFDDNIPDGLVDPFGWQPDSPDPWETYTFSYAGQPRTGNKSSYLWSSSLAPLTITAGKTGGTFSYNRSKVIIPKNLFSNDVILTIEPSGSIVSDNNVPLGQGITVTVNDGFGNLITNFSSTFKILLNYSGFDLTRLKQETISIYSSQDGQTWQKENTTVNLLNSQASTDINHLTHFALVAEKIDKIKPSTFAFINGVEPTSLYGGPIEITLLPIDEPEPGSLGVAYTLYAINDGEWKTYENPIPIINEGNYDISFYSADKDGNVEAHQKVSFTIAFPTPTPTMTPTTIPTSVPTETLTPSPTTPIETPSPTLKPKPLPSRYACKMLEIINRRPRLKKNIKAELLKKLKLRCEKG